jgi:hypothetical protein
MDTVANIESAVPAAGAAAPKPTAAKSRQSPLVRFPYQCHAAITAPMARSIERLSSGNSLKRNADILREALHLYLMHYDQAYRHDIGANTGNQGNG